MIWHKEENRKARRRREEEQDHSSPDLEEFSCFGTAPLVVACIKILQCSVACGSEKKGINNMQWANLAWTTGLLFAILSLQSVSGLVWSAVTLGSAGRWWNVKILNFLAAVAVGEGKKLKREGYWRSLEKLKVSVSFLPCHTAAGDSAYLQHQEN